ncbi:MAG: zf-HC2 domain-containing protein [Synergistaceae bacterium]|nr:zf-HC2 domain-containing protein [Synergistaceae bacterium]
MNRIDDEHEETGEKIGERCDDFELLISKECDGECSHEEMRALGKHLEECPECRATREIYREICALMGERIASMAPPSIPRADRRIPLRVLGRGSIRTRLMRLGGIAACILFFAAGQYWGQSRVRGELPEIAPDVAVATPSMWIEGRSPDSAKLVMEAEQPFADSISRYRSAIGEELREENVDWVLIRELVEAMGDLRTDLELLTIHMAYIDIRTGSSPVQVAEHWERLGRIDGKAVFAP